MGQFSIKGGALRKGGTFRTIFGRWAVNKSGVCLSVNYEERVEH